MAVCEIHFGNANALQKMISATVILPEGKGGPFPVLYLLHGLSDDHTTWVRRTSIERYVEGMPLIVVMPNGERSFYTDSEANPKAAFETMIVRDLGGFVDGMLNTVAERTGRATWIPGGVRPARRSAAWPRRRPLRMARPVPASTHTAVRVAKALPESRSTTRVMSVPRSMASSWLKKPMMS